MMAAESLGMAPDLEQAYCYLARFGGPEAEQTWQVFDDLKSRRDKRLATWLQGPLTTHLHTLTRAQAHGAGVFMTVNQTDGRGRKLENIRAVRAVWGEYDHGLPEVWPLPPQLVVESSPGKYHVYWVVAGLTLDQFDGVMARMVADYGSDPNARDRARVLRVPGFYHLKDPARPFQVRIVAHAGADAAAPPYSASAILAAFPPLERPAAVAQADPDPIASPPPSAHRALVMELASRAAKRTHELPTLGRHSMVLWLGRECAHRGLPETVGDEAVKLFAELMRPCDTAGVIAGLNWEHERKSFSDAHAKGLTDPPEKRRNSMPRPVTVLPSAVVADVSVGGFDEAWGGAGIAPPPPSFADLDERPEVVVGGDRLIAAMQEAERILFEGRTAPYYIRGGVLFRVTERTKSGSGGEPIPAVTTLEPVGPGWLRQTMMRSVKFVQVKHKDGDLVRYAVNLPKDYPESYCSWSASDWWAPELRAVVEAPVLFRDGSILHKPGYHPASRLLLASAVKWQLPPKRKPGEKINPAADEAIEEACNIFGDLFCGPDRFSPATPQDYACMVAAVLTSLVKTEVGAAPGWVVTAPIWGSSKGKFVDIVSIVRCGRRAPMMTMPADRRGGADEGKLEDQLFAALLDGGGLMVIDEVQRQLHSTTLRSMVTAEEYVARIKGLSKIATVRPVDSQWMAVGNNLIVSADDARRWLRIYLDPKTDQPHKRVFDRDCLEHAQANRVRIVWAALTLLQGYIHAGMPDMGIRLGSFERWAALVPSCLVWAGFENPIDTMQAWHEADSERMKLGALLEAWLAFFGGASLTAKTACAELSNGPPALPHRAGGTTELETLRSVLDDICGDAKGLQSRLLGGYLANRKNRRVGPLRFVDDGKYQGAVKWRVLSDQPGASS